MSGRWILLPGTLCTGDVFAPLLDALSVSPDDRVVLPVNRPRTADYRDTLAKSLRPGDILCGFSLGAIVAAHNAEATRDARACILLALNPRADRPERRAYRETVRARVKAGDARGVIRDGWNRMSADRGESLQEFVADMADKTAHLIDPQTELALSRTDAENILRGTSTPTLFINGTADQMTPPGPVNAIARRLPKAGLAQPENLGHFALLEDPSRVARMISDWLATLA